MSIHQIIQPPLEDCVADASPKECGDAEASALEAALADMTATFSDDFANGRVGMRHNTYEHRSRVLRQMAGRLLAMRAGNASVVS